MLKKDIRAGNTAYYLGKDLIRIAERNEPVGVSFDTDTSHGRFSADMSLKLVRDTKRLQGFIRAIKRWPEQEAVMDVGCGAFPILALAAAIYHPRAEIKAIEINPKSAEAARQFVHHFGFSERVQVVNADIANHPIDPNTTAAVTETFNAALQEEPGPKIVRLLHQAGVSTITPSRAELRLQIVDTQFLQSIDLRRDTHACIAFDNRSSFSTLDNEYEEWSADVSAAYFDDLGIVLPYDADTISRGLPSVQKAQLKKVIAQVEGAGRLIYELGYYPFSPSATSLEAVSTGAVGVEPGS